MKITLYAVVILIVILSALSVWIRIAPIDPGRWNVDLTAPSLKIGDNWVGFCPAPGKAGPVNGAEALSHLDDIALATPRTRRLAGSPSAGEITWVTRSAVFGFPDFTTAQVLPDGTLCVVARQGIGRDDFGVNARRLGAWIRLLPGVTEPLPLDDASQLRARLHPG